MNEKQPGDKESPGLVDDGLGGLTYQGIGMAMAVHNNLGPGHRESTYHNAMHLRYLAAELPAESEPELPIYDEHGDFVNYYCPDHRIDQLLVEYKSHFYPLSNDETAQCIDYLTASGEHVVLLFNFGRRRLEWKRIFPPKKVSDHRRQNWQRTAP